MKRLTIAALLGATLVGGCNSVESQQQPLAGGTPRELFAAYGYSFMHVHPDNQRLVFTADAGAGRGEVWLLNDPPVL